METRPITPERLAASVIAVPPLSRQNGRVSKEENLRLIRYLEQGGISTFLYGGNALLYHIQMDEYAQLLAILRDGAGANSLIVPSVGPAYGTMLDQVAVLRDFDFPTAMVLPSREITDQLGLARGIRAFAEAYGKPIVLYLKHDRWLAPELVKGLYEDGLISWIKYAVVLDDPSRDDYLREVLDVVPAQWIVSGIGEQPAIIHMRDFGMISYTSGCVCVAPKLSTRMLKAIQAKDYSTAEMIREQFLGLEDLRNNIQPIRVLHRAVSSAGLAETGPIQPMLSELTDKQLTAVKAAAVELLAKEGVRT